MHVLLAPLLILLASTPLPLDELTGGVPRPPAPAEPSVEAQIMALEQHRAEAMRTKNIAALAQLFSDDYVSVSSNGEVRNKQDTLRNFEAYLPSDQHNDEVQVRVYGDTAVVMGRTIVKIRQSGRLGTVHSRFIRVWVRRGDRWENVAFQATYLLLRFP